MNPIRSLIELVTSLFRRTPAPTDAMPKPPLPGGRPPVPSTDTDQEKTNGTEQSEYQDDAPGISGEPAWLTKARKEDGTREAPGARDNPRISAYFADAGHPEVVSDETAWCAAFVGAMLERCGVRSTRSLMAKSYLNWGKPLAKPRMGAIMVFSRTGDPRFGHVGFYVGEDHDSYLILGGNQWNSKTQRSEIVNVGRQPKSRLCTNGIRWPSTPTNSRTVKGAATTGAGTVMQQTAAAIPDTTVANQVQDAGQQLQTLGHVKWWLGAVGTFLIVAGILWVIYVRLDDIKQTGR